MSVDVATLVADVEDPELPHVTIGDLGMVRSVDVDDRNVRVHLIPTYTGCPATEQIVSDVTAAIEAADFDATVIVDLSPAWSTDLITQRGRQRLLAAGIAPPCTRPTAAELERTERGGVTTGEAVWVTCPRCGSRRTERVAEFGSTACKASYRCTACREPFDYFKPF